jgi:hypothetical protein
MAMIFNTLPFIPSPQGRGDIRVIIILCIVLSFEEGFPHIS